MDVRNKSKIDESFKTIKEKYSSPPSLLVNSAGVVRLCDLENYTEEDYHHVMDTNFKVEDSCVKLAIS